MKLYRPFLSLIAIILSVVSIKAQPFSVKGVVTDTLNANRLHYSTITLIRAKDSILETFTRTKEDGSFQLQVKNPGSYIIMVTYPSFADYIDILILDKKKEVDLGVIPMVSKSHLLNEFVLKQQIAAIKIKGDTTEYVADSFKVRENATVEELLKKLPGIQVNKNGEVVAQGEKVQKILVDGEEFFTDDPAVVTKSLQAKAVDKVQVYDKKSDQAIFSGIDDGTREKTINLKLKDNMKRGYFGKVVAGGGTDGFFENQAMLNAFKNKRKFSVFGIIANTGKIGLGWQDADKFGGGNGSVTEFTEDGTMISYYSSDDDDDFQSWGGTYNGQGLPTAWTGGAHYSNKWLEDKLHLSTNYRYAKQNIETDNNNITELNLDSTRIYTNEKKNTFFSGERHRVDALYEWKTDSTSQLKLTANAGYQQSTKTIQDYTETVNADGEKLNDNTSSQKNDATTKSVNATLNWQKKFAKKGRTAVVTIDEKYRENDGTGYVNAALNYYSFSDPALIDSTRHNDQLKENYSKSFQLTGKVSYTEPLSKTLFLEVNYAGALNNNTSRKLSYDKSAATDNYDSLNYLYSSNYDFDVFTNTGGSNLRLVLKQINITVGGAISNTQFTQKDLLGNTYSYNRNFTNFFPKAAFIFRPKGKQASFSVNYNGSTQQPSINQIQPLRQNMDLLNESIGNPDLKQEFDHSLNLRYNNYKILSGTYTYGGGGINFVNNDISQSQTINAGGKRVYQYINVNGNYNGWLYVGYGMDLKKLDMRVAIRGNANISHVNNYINGQKNVSNNNSYTLGFDWNYDKEKKFNIWYNPSVTFNNNTSTINTNSTNYWSFENQLNASFELPWKLEIGTDVDWYIRERVAGFDRNNNVFRWNAYVSKKLLKGDALEIRASAFDILNQNLGFSRYGSGNTITEQNYNTIRRYGMLSLIWNFTKTAAGVPQQEGGDMIIVK